MLIVGLTGGIGAGKSTVAQRLACHGAAVVDVDALGREIIAPGGLAVAAVLERFGSHLRAPDGGIDRPALARLVFGDADKLAALNDISHPFINQLLDERIESLAAAGSAVVAGDDAAGSAVPGDLGAPSGGFAAVTGDAAGSDVPRDRPERGSRAADPAIAADRSNADAAARDTGIVVLDMAVLVESTLGRETRFPYEVVVTVEAPPDARLKRLVERGMTAEDAKARIASQATDEQRRAASNFVIHNGGDTEALADATARLWNALCRLADERAA